MKGFVIIKKGKDPEVEELVFADRSINEKAAKIAKLLKSLRH